VTSAIGGKFVTIALAICCGACRAAFVIVMATLHE
jgi:hypothetical protein